MIMVELLYPNNDDDDVVVSTTTNTTTTMSLSSSTASSASSSLVQQQQQEEEEQQQPHHHRRREICDYCLRPKLHTCICSAIPKNEENKIILQYTYCIILQHPNESKQHINRSLPFIEYCINKQYYYIEIGRRFSSRITNILSNQFVQMYNTDTTTNNNNDTTTTVYNNNNNDIDDPNIRNSVVLQPQPQQQPQSQSQETLEPMIWLLSSTEHDTTISLTQALDQWEEYKTKVMTVQQQQQQQTFKKSPKIIIIALDATWKYAKEMDTKNIQYNCYPSNIIRVRLTSNDFYHPLFQTNTFNECIMNTPNSTTKTTSSSSTTTTTTATATNTIRHRFAIRTPPSQSMKSKIKTTTDEGNNINNTTSTSLLPTTTTTMVYLSTAECLAYVLARIEQNDTIYHTIMKPLDLMVEQWQFLSKRNKTKVVSEKVTKK